MSADKMFLYQSPVVAILNDHEFELVEPFVFQWTENNTVHRITVPRGFAFDGASVPRLCWTLTGLLPSGVHLGAAAVHDLIYQRRGLLNEGQVECQNPETGLWESEPVHWDRKQCDAMFRTIMQSAGETPWKIITMYQAVRLFGAIAWNQ